MSDLPADALGSGSIPAPSSSVSFDPDFAVARDAFLKPPAASHTGLLFVVSMALFILAGSGRSGGVTGLVLLVVVLLVHELGHLAGMRVLGYQDLKIFFIPFFGAAASGRKAGVPAWQQGTVALLGPLPGILIAFVLALGYVLAPSALLKDAVVSFGAINAFNLLPVAPLDGGFLFQAALFSRSRRAESFFQVVAVLGSLGLAILLETWVLGFVAVMMLFALPLQLKITRAGDELRQGGTLPAAAADLTEPQQRLLYDKARELEPSDAAAKQLPNLMRSLHERALWRPPSLGASAGLLLVWGSGVAVAIAALVLLVVGGPVPTF